MEENDFNSAILYQNKPNPFKENTTIDYEIPNQSSSASIMVFNMSGSLLKTYKIPIERKGSLIIESGSFKPGMYLYSLIVDEIEIDTKKMIIQE